MDEIWKKKISRKGGGGHLWHVLGQKSDLIIGQKVEKILYTIEAFWEE